MKRFLFLVASSVFLSFGIASAFETCRVERIIDGDTFVCLNHEMERITIRLAQIDAPEKDQPYGHEAAISLSRIILNEDIQVDQLKNKDRYGRVIAQAYYDDLDVNKRQIINGAAWFYEGYGKDSSYKKEEESARLRRAGLWSSGKEPVKPWIWRKREY